jgi:FkbM family methyltransferase
MQLPTSQIRVFDIGMYDGADTEYYLELDFQVVAVEANPDLVQNALQKFRRQIASGQLTCINAAISANGEAVELALSGTDLGSSSLFCDRIANKHPIGSITVPGVLLSDLFLRYGMPDYLKVDIEGSDRLCVLCLTHDKRPDFLSFEVGADVCELLEHAEAIGFKRFKMIDQVSFRELARQNCLYDRIARRTMRYLRYAEPLRVRRAGRFFVSGHSSGPIPWHSDGRWYSAGAMRARLGQMESADLNGWYDIHAAVG